MRTVTAVAMMLAGALPAQAADWRYVGELTEYPAIIAYVDDASVQYVNGQTDYIFVYYVEGDTVDQDGTVRQQRRTRCTDTSFQILSERRWIGTTEEFLPQPDKGPVYADPGSIDQDALDMICGRRSYKGGSIADPEQHAKDFFANLAASGL